MHSRGGLLGQHLFGNIKVQKLWKKKMIEQSDMPEST